MRWPWQKIGWLASRAALGPFRAAIEGGAIGALLGLVDVHSKGGDWFDALPAYFIAGLVLGLRHARRSWQAWVPLGFSLYLAHLVAIARGYRQPYVEVNADATGACLIVLFPAGLGLALGVFARWFVSCLVAIDPARTSSKPLPRRPMTVWRLMVVVAWIGIHLAALRVLFINDPFFGFGTVYSEGYSESRFKTLRVGMTAREVEAIVGPPLGKVPWNQHTGSRDEEMWYYSKHPSDTANYWRRWVNFEKGKVAAITDDFWFD